MKSTSCRIMRNWLQSDNASNIPQCTILLQKYAHMSVHTWTHFCYKIAHCGIRDWWTVGFVRHIYCASHRALTHWGQVKHICVGNLNIVASDDGLSPGWCQAIIWTNAGILLIRSLRTNCSEILMEIHTFSFNKTHLKMSSAKWRPCCLGLNVLTKAFI